MFLLMMGQGEQPWDWKVDEPVSAGYARIYFLEKGVILYREGDRERVLQPGHLYVFSPSMPYAMRHAPDPVFTCTWLHADFSPQCSPGYWISHWRRTPQRPVSALCCGN